MVYGREEREEREIKGIIILKRKKLKKIGGRDGRNVWYVNDNFKKLYYEYKIDVVLILCINKVIIK